jgi:peptidoglycan/LPS O-acetylase OafA/YrhL
MGKEIRCLQALHGAACLAVVILHLGNWEAVTRPRWPLLLWSRTCGWAGVDLFFVLSDFIITWTQDRNVGRPSALGTYVCRRLWRIYSVCWACWGGAVLAYLLVWRVPVGNHSGVAACVNQLLLWPRDCGNHYSPVAWTLTYEDLFYIFFGAFIVTPRRWFIRLLSAWTVIVAANIVFRQPQADGPVWLPVAPLTFEFLMGCWAAIAYRRLARGTNPVLVSGVAGVVAGITILSAWLTSNGPGGRRSLGRRSVWWSMPDG